MEEVDSRQFKVESKQKQNQEKTGKNYASEIWWITNDSFGSATLTFNCRRWTSLSHSIRRAG